MESADELAPAPPAEPPAPPAADFDLVTALQTRGCPICDYLEQVAFEFLRHFQYRLATHEAAQRRFAEQSGFCPLHTWQLAGLMSPQGLSAGLPALAERVSAAIAGAAASAGGNPGVRAVGRANGEQCQVCALLRPAEIEFAARLGRFAGTRAGQAAYARSQGVCLRHLEHLLGAVPTDAGRTLLLSEAGRRFGELAEDLRAYALKREALRAGLATGDEEDAHWRALVHLVGGKRVCIP